MKQQIYDYLCQNHVGKKNLINNYDLRILFGICSDKALRKVIEDIRLDSNFTEFVASQAGKNGGYWIADNINDCKETIEHLEKRALKILATSEILEIQMGLKYGRN